MNEPIQDVTGRAGSLESLEALLTDLALQEHGESDDAVARCLRSRIDAVRSARASYASHLSLLAEAMAQ